MANQILGLISGKDFEDEDFYNRTNRRRVFHDFPTGAFPLTGLLSLMEDEATDSYKYGWFEKRMILPETTLIDGTGGTEGPFSASGSDTPAASPLTVNAGTTYRLKVASTAKLTVRQQIRLVDLAVAGGTASVQGIIEQIVNSTTLEFTVITTVAGITNTEAGNGAAADKRLHVIGNAAAEGARSQTGKFTIPVNPENVTQIFRNAFEFTATALQVPTEFDQTGIYRETAEEALRDHMVELELAFLFGEQGVQNVTLDGTVRPRRTTGGIYWFLREWEKADSLYRGGAGAPAITNNADSLKRIIKLGGSITEEVFDSYIERAFRTTNSKTFEKIVVCGNGALAAVNNYLKKVQTLNKDYTVQKVYGMNVVTWESPWGTLHFKTHPLFNRDISLFNTAMIIDVNLLKYRHLNDRDTDVLPNRQENDFDGRKDEWLTEAGLEVNLPEAHMVFENLTAITSA